MAAVLDFMADHPGQAFALTDLVRALKLSRATCHALLTGLVEVGYLYRATDKTYVLGPALAAIGRVAQEHFSPLQIAKPEMRRLADDFDVVCSAMFQEGDFIVSRERAASVSHVGYSLPLGTRVKMRPRSIGIFFAWLPAEAQAFLDKADPPLTVSQRAAIEANIAFVREHGFNVHVQNPSAPAEEWAIEIMQGDGSEPRVVLLNRLVADVSYSLSSIVAPVFDARGRVEFVLGLMGFNRAMTGAEIAVAGDRLKAACARIGDFMSGRVG
jgi:DNA-binding IclR family transcriptional regulator